MTREELLTALGTDHPDDQVEAYLDGVQGEGATHQRPIIGVSVIDGKLLLIIGRRKP